jgi:hypothetical protein
MKVNNQQRLPTATTIYDAEKIVEGTKRARCAQQIVQGAHTKLCKVRTKLQGAHQIVQGVHTTWQYGDSIFQKKVKVLGAATLPSHNWL